MALLDVSVSIDFYTSFINTEVFGNFISFKCGLYSHIYKDIDG